MLHHPLYHFDGQYESVSNPLILNKGGDLECNQVSVIPIIGNLYYKSIFSKLLLILQAFIWIRPKSLTELILFSEEWLLLFLAHLSRRLEWAIAVCFRPSCVVRRASCVVRRASSVNFLHFHLLLENTWLDFNQTWQESSLVVGDSKLFK